MKNPIYVDHEEITAHPEGLEFYKSGLLRKWRWRITAGNGKIIGASSQGYYNLPECEYNAKSVAFSIGESLMPGKLFKE